MHAHGGPAFGGFAIQHEGGDKSAHQHFKRHAAIRPGRLGPFQCAAPRRRDQFRPAQIGGAEKIPLGPKIIMQLRQIDPGGERDGAGGSTGKAMIRKEHLRHVQDSVADAGRGIKRGKKAGHQAPGFGQLTDEPPYERFGSGTMKKPRN